MSVRRAGPRGRRCTRGDGQVDVAVVLVTSRTAIGARDTSPRPRASEASASRPGWGSSGRTRRGVRRAPASSSDSRRWRSLERARAGRDSAFPATRRRSRSESSGAARRAQPPAWQATRDDQGSGRARAGGRGTSSTWVNTRRTRRPHVAGLRGRVVLLDFWTYSCINCLRTLPHLEAWDRAYRATGLTIVGVHSPEFAFERVPDNVRAAVKRLGVRYPVALDNDFATWRAYSNQYWPAKYLIDRNGRLRFHHFGEGTYEDTERRIRALLGETVKTPPTDIGRGTRRRRSSRRPSHTWATSGSRGSRTAGSCPTSSGRTCSRKGRSPNDASRMPGAGRSSASASSPRAAHACDCGSRRRTSSSCWGRGPRRAYSSTDGAMRTVGVSGSPGCTRSRGSRTQAGAARAAFSPGIAGYAFTFG